MRITESDFNNWWNAPVGVEVKKMLHDRMTIIAHDSMAESFVRDNITSAVRVGRYKEIQDLLKMKFSELMGE